MQDTSKKSKYLRFDEKTKTLGNMSDANVLTVSFLIHR